VGDFNLGQDCIQDKKTKAAYREYLKRDDILRSEIEAKLGSNFMDTSELQPELEDDDYDSDEDTGDIPLESIISHELGVEGPFAISHSEFCLNPADITEEGGQFKPAADVESVWTLDVEEEHDSEDDK
jgi:hypothetical protein